MAEHIVLIGAGSATFTCGLVADLIRQASPVDLALVDVDPQALMVAEKLTRKMIAAKNAPITLSAATDRREVLPDATVVICTIGVGGRRAWEQDVFIPRKYGIYLPVGDTVGPGGSSRALRMIPAMIEIAHDVLDYAPRALFFNYANPMAPICRAIVKATGAKVVGLCHGVMHAAKYLADALQLPREALNYTAVGTNHLTWFTSICDDGHDLMPELREIASARLAAGFAPTPPRPASAYQRMIYPDVNLFDWELLLRFGAFASAMDRHITEFFPQFFRDGNYYGLKLGVDAFSFEATIQAGDETFAAMARDAQEPEPLSPDYFNRFSGEHEQVMDIIDSIRRERGLVFSANLPNTGQVPNLPQQAIVESPAVAAGSGLQAIALPPLPPTLAGLLATRYEWVETIVEAALEGSRDKFIQALVLDGYVGSLQTAVELADDLLIAQAQYLPQFR